MRTRLWLGAALAAVVVALAIFHPDRSIDLASGAVSQNICSQTFVSGLAPDDIYREDMRPEGGMGLIDWALRYDVDRAHRTVTTTVAGLFKRTAVYREGYGCALQYDGVPSDLPPPAAMPASDMPLPVEIAPDTSTNPRDVALREAVEAAFTEDAANPRHTHAVVVVHKGRVVAEKYAPHYGPETKLLSHSIAKSVINALIAILVRDGKLSVNDSNRVPAWSAQGPQSKITVDQLLRMASGLPLDEGQGPGRSQIMWFTQADNDAYATSSPLEHAPGTAMRYSNQGYAVLSKIVRDAIGGGPREVTDFAARELFAPAGMTSAVMEFDASGTPMGGNAVFATARDWARFGLLYLNDGVVNGRRIFPEGWVAYSTKQTLDAGYGAGFWLNVTDAPIPVWDLPWGIPGAPRDAYFARGYLGQYVIVIPSENVVIVRFGASHKSMGDIKGVGALVRDVVAALHKS